MHTTWFLNGKTSTCSLLRASSYAEQLRLRIAVIHGQKEVEHDNDETDRRNSPPPMIEQEPKEPAVYTVPAGARRQRNDSSKFSEYLISYRA